LRGVRELEEKIIELINRRTKCPKPPDIPGDLGLFIFREISSRWKPRVAYLGPEKSFTWDAAIGFFPNSQLIPARTIAEVFRLLESGEVDYGVVPFINSLEGPVGETIDALTLHSAYIIAVGEMRITLCFAKRGEPKVIYSHPHAIAQARRFLSMLGAQAVYTNSTSEAVEKFKQCSNCGVIASPRALEGEEKLCGVEDSESYTRFAIVARTKGNTGSRAALIFAVPNRPGALYSALSPLAENNVNMTLIYSRPTKLSPWDYFFLVEIEYNDGAKRAIEKMYDKTTMFKLIGVYNLFILSDQNAGFRQP